MSGKIVIRLLLIDDDEGAHAALRAILKTPPPTNVQLFAAESITNGHRMIDEVQPQAILLDMNLSRAHRGVATLEEIHGLRDHADAPVLMFTGGEIDEPIGGGDVGKPGELWPMAIKYGALNCLEKSVYLNLVFEKGEHGAKRESCFAMIRGMLLHSITNAMFLHDEWKALSQTVPHEA